MPIPFVVPVVIAAGTGGALLWQSVQDFIIGEKPQTVINVEDGGTLNTDKSQGTDTTALLLLAGGVFALWFYLKKGR